MTGLNSWLSPAVLHALGWALIHSLWQCAGVAALAALVMAFIRRPAVRYVIGVGALALMLAAPVATFLVLARPVAPAPVLQPATALVLPATPPPSTPVAVFATADRAIAAVTEAPRQFPVGDMLPWLVAAWACGVAFFSLRFAGGFLLLEHRRRTQSHSPGERVLALCLDLQRRLGLDRAVQYLECAWVEAPAVIGWLRPAVLMPVFALTGLSEEQFKAVIAHELAHIRRHDWLVNLFQVLVESLLFYHPAMWWLNRRIRIERELCCDEIAVSLTGSRLEYARALAQMAEWKNVSMLAMAANRGPLTQRILHILGRGAPGAGQRVAGLTGGMLFLVAALAAANLLVGIAYPVQMAEAKESMRTALISSQTAVEHLARRVVLTAKDVVPPTLAPGQMDAAADGKADALAAPSPDLSRLLPSGTLTTPTVMASNVAPATPAQPAMNAPAATAADAGSVASSSGYTCYNSSVYGRVVSSETVQMPGFVCRQSIDQQDFTSPLNYGPCPYASTYYPSPKRCSFDVSLNVRLADPADAAKMQPGRMVRLAGEFRVELRNHAPYIYVSNAKVIWTDPFSQQAASDGPAKVIRCGNTSVFGRVLSANAVEMQGFYCILSGTIGDNSSAIQSGSCPLASTYSYPGDPSGPFSRDPSRTYLGDMVGPLNRLKEKGTECAFDIQMNVRLADPADAARMKPGRMVRLAGDFQITRQSGTDYLSVMNARVTWADPFDRHAANASLPGGFQITRRDGTDYVTLASAAAPGRDPRNRTELAMKCWLGVVGYKGCWQSLCGVGDAGPLERVDYLGRTAAGADIYQVRYRYRAAIAYEVVPDPQGTADQYLFKATDPYWIKREISSPAAPQLIYARPENAPPAGCYNGGIVSGAQLNPVDPYPPGLMQPPTTP